MSANSSVCTLQTCPLSDSNWGYRPSLAANGLLIGLFGLSGIAFLVQLLLSRRFFGFGIAFIIGCAMELAGYIGRVMSYYDPFSQNGFLINICCLTIAPAFFAAGIYLCLSRIVVVFGPENSRLRPMWYPRIFIPCDFVSLVLQGTGGGMASVASNNNSDPKPGNHIMLAGLAFQAATMFVFILLSLDFALRTYGRVKGLGADKALDHQYHELRRSPAFRAFLAALALATLLIFTRCVYRVAELSEGWNGHLILTQSYFLVLESAVVIIACLLLNAAHPAFCFAAGYATGTSGFFGRNWKKTNAARSRQWSDTGAKAPV